MDTMDRDAIKKGLMDQFKGIYVDVVGCDGGSLEYDVRCFGVEEGDYEAVTTAVLELDEELFPYGNAYLSAIVFTLGETETHYPEIASRLHEVRERGRLIRRHELGA